MSDPFIWVRAIHFAATILMMGSIWFAAFIAEPAFRNTDDRTESAAAEATVRVGLTWLAWFGLAGALISGAAWLLFVTARMADLPLANVFAGTAVETTLTQTSFGQAWIIRLLLVMLVAISLRLTRDTGIAGPLWKKVLTVSLTGGFVGTVAWSGHAAAGSGVEGAVHLASDILHLLAAAAWLGGLLPLAITLRATLHAPDPDLSAVASEAVARFSILGIVSVGTLLLTGIVNSWMLVGRIAALIDTDYGRLLCVKVALFLCMVALAGVNRLILTPRLRGKQGETAQRAARQIETNSLIEAALGTAILLAAALLGTLPPGIASEALVSTVLAGHFGR